MSSTSDLLTEARQARDRGEDATAMNLCNQVLSSGETGLVCETLIAAAQMKLKCNAVDEAIALGKTATSLQPDRTDAWRLLNDALQRKLDWQVHLQHEPQAVNQTLRDLTAARTEIMRHLSGRKTEPGARPSPAKADNILEELAAKYKPSKRAHDYIRHFWLHFGENRLKVRKFIEIGLADHKGEKHPDSLMMWEDFFPNAEVWGIDINPECAVFEGGRRRILIGDQKDPAFLERVVKATGADIDIIVDDGEHTPQAILTSFTWLFGALNDHGIYAVEDILHQRRVQQFFLDLADGVSHWPTEFHMPDWPFLRQFESRVEWVRKNITGVAFYRFLCFVMRGYNPEDNPYLRFKPAPKA